MTTVNDVVRFLETLAPREMKMEWDNVGLLCGEEHQPVRRILVALDPFRNVCEEAAACSADLLVTHHPLIFRPLRTVTDQNTVGREILFLARHGISAVNAHTNLDQASGGVNDCLAAALGLRNVTAVNPQGTDAQGREWGLLRKGETEETELADFAAFVKRTLGCPGLRFVSGGKPVRTVAVGGGSCADEMLDAIDAGCDTLVTADAKYNQFRDAYDLGLNLIDAGHFETERPVCAYLAARLREQFPETEVILSKNQFDPVQFL